MVGGCKPRRERRGKRNTMLGLEKRDPSVGMPAAYPLVLASYRDVR